MKTIVVTGGSRGIGLKTIHLLLKKGHRVLNLSRKTPEIDEIYIITGNFTHIPFDLKNPDITKLEDAFSQLSSIDVIFNNAGFLINKPFALLNKQDFSDVFQINVFSIVQIVQTALKYLSPKAHIVNVSSIGGLHGSQKFPGLSAYSSSKGAVTILTECLQAEFQDTGYTFNGLAFGAVQTEMLSEAFPGYKAPISAAEMAEFVTWFLLNGHKFFKGKILPVSLSNP
ncbi:short-chain dehydrogenase [Thermaurantimonas aggregans]|uniref:Short-chain dehydrogenase n=1 Tax=Thermaurantimonas aggregans TaxID=2173829 RepID=A0A401XKV1_9FLAO|nr:SDR family NAD(P)-dependent oxidoreductase [Thermaurantimonas aggregans]MCX8148193.1 SDR family oxidoreductase [Thermaurantimonas aggregans]GCD77623.1 short-chain dehydrogenase [Thermaurantimonas aggregans]